MKTPPRENDRCLDAGPDKLGPKRVAEADCSVLCRNVESVPRKGEGSGNRGDRDEVTGTPVDHSGEEDRCGVPEGIDVDTEYVLDLLRRSILDEGPVAVAGVADHHVRQTESVDCLCKSPGEPFAVGNVTGDRLDRSGSTAGHLLGDLVQALCSARKQGKPRPVPLRPPQRQLPPDPRTRTSYEYRLH